MKRTIKNNKGITLIALVVTIIVLIILAVISINLVFGQDGIIARAEKARDVERAASVEESVELWKANNKAAKYTKEGTQTKSDLLNQLVAEGLITSEEKAIIEQTGSITIGEKTITIEESTARTLVEMYDAGELKIGDYVNYANPTSGETIIYGTDSGMQDAKNNGEDVLDEQLNQVYRVANNQPKWRVLGKDEETGGIKLIAETILNKETTNNDPYLYMYGAKSYLYGAEAYDEEGNETYEDGGILNHICAMYKNDLAIKARSVNVDDINKAVGIIDEDDIQAKNIYGLDIGMPYGETYSFTDQYTPESWLNGKERTVVEGTSNAYLYAINLPGEGVPTVNVNETIMNLLFDNTGEGEEYYWLGSCGILKHREYVDFGPGVVVTEEGGVSCVYSGSTSFYSNTGREMDYAFGVRPVVILKNDVTEHNIQKI